MCVGYILNINNYKHIVLYSNILDFYILTIYPGILLNFLQF